LAAIGVAVLGLRRWRTSFVEDGAGKRAPSKARPGL
jgi:hypothetical protein